MNDIRGIFSQAFKTGAEFLPTVPLAFGGSIVAQPDQYTSQRVQKNQDALEKALFILSQSDTGRYLVSSATAGNFKAQFNQAATTEAQAQGYVHERKIVISDHDDLAALASLLSHECAHVVQNLKMPGAMPTAGMHPVTVFKHCWATEADAFAHQIQVALELAYAPQINPGRAGTQALLRYMHKTYPVMTGAALTSIEDVSDITSGRAMAFAFRAFYETKELRTIYETRMATWLIDQANTYAQAGVSLNKFCADKEKPGNIATRMQWRGQKYLADHLPQLDLNHPYYAGLTPETGDLMRGFHQHYFPDRQMPNWKILARTNARISQKPLKGMTLS